MRPSRIASCCGTCSPIAVSFAIANAPSGVMARETSKGDWASMVKLPDSVSNTPRGTPEIAPWHAACVGERHDR